MDPRLRDAIARIDIIQSGNSNSRGTGVLVGSDLVLTAFHVVADRKAPGLVPYPGRITLTFLNQSTEATIAEGQADQHADWILLRCAVPPSRVLPIPLADRADDEERWETFGFPDANPRDGLVFTGTVTHAAGTFDDVPVYQLFSPQAAAGTGAPVKGLSGGPIIVDGAVVGLLRSSLMREGQNVAGTLYACPISSVRQRSRDLLPSSIERAKEGTPQPPSVGDQVVLNIHEDQSEWRGLTAWASTSPSNIVQLNRPFDLRSFENGHPSVLIFPLPYKRFLFDSQVAEIKSWVEKGGGLLVFGYYAPDTHHGTNISRLTREWDISFADDLLMPVGLDAQNARDQAFDADQRFGAEVQLPSESHDSILAGVKSLVINSSASLDLRSATVPLDFRLDIAPTTERWRPEGPLDKNGQWFHIRRWISEGQQSRNVVVGFRAGRGKVAIVGSWKLAALDYRENRRFVENVINWLRPQPVGPNG